MEALLLEARSLSGDFDALSQAVAGRVGLSATELLAMDLISRDTPVTAGHLAQHLHLTTGAITGLVDRLERAGFVRRRADRDDRRRVLVVPTAKGERIGALFAPLAGALRSAASQYSQKDLELLTGFLAEVRTAVAQTTESVRRPRLRA